MLVRLNHGREKCSRYLITSATVLVPTSVLTILGRDAHPSGIDFGRTSSTGRGSPRLKRRRLLRRRLSGDHLERGMFQNLFKIRLPRPARAARHSRYLPVLEPLAERILPAVTASFKGGILTVNGDAQANNIVISRNAAGRIFVNGGAVKIQGAVPRVAKVALIQVFGRNGNDRITLNEAKGPLPKAKLIGGRGNDILTGGA